ncbi:hypothetical protein AB0J86_05495 [Micromonospora sp. NPDC049559]|uniref:hypothetical protein n=1 Tax=Micromonospora sp. NPDC049559 TaxID=3155923 RepID=UPI003441B560
MAVRTSRSSPTAAGAGGVGADVDPERVGRRVASRTGTHGGYAQRTLVPANGLVPVPNAVELTGTAALLHDGSPPRAWLTWYASSRAIGSS